MVNCNECQITYVEEVLAVLSVL